MIAVAFALTAVGLFAAPASTFAWASDSYSSADESQLITLTNQARASAGLGALKVDSTLRSIARWRSKDMAVRNYFDHAIPNPPAARSSTRWTGAAIATRSPARTSAGTTRPTRPPPGRS